MPRVTFGIIVLNGLPFLEYNLRGLYPLAHQIVVVEGAVKAAASLATPDGHSTDGTLELLKRFKSEHDPEDKLEIVTAEDEGYPDGFWEEKEQMSQAYASRATADWLWQVDSDEFFFRRDMEAVFTLLDTDPQISAVSFPYREFWGGFEYYQRGQWYDYEQPAFHRLFRWESGYKYVDHRPPTVFDEQGRDLRSLKWVSEQEMRRRGIYLYHYSYVFPKQAEQKVGYYSNVSWTDAFRENQRWLQDSYYGLKRPFYIGEKRGALQWLARYYGAHPGQISQLRADLEKGRLKEPVRQTEDIEQLLGSPWYALQRWLVAAFLFLSWHTKQLVKPIMRGIRQRGRKDTSHTHPRET